jgi:hypothetical protein
MLHLEEKRHPKYRCHEFVIVVRFCARGCLIESRERRAKVDFAIVEKMNYLMVKRTVASFGPVAHRSVQFTVPKTLKIVSRASASSDSREREYN